MMYEVKLVRTVIEYRVLLVDSRSSKQARRRACAIARGETEAREDDEHEGDWEPGHITKSHVLAVRSAGIQEQLDTTAISDIQED